jgi:hypothetical protein
MIGARLANPRSSVRRLYLVVHNIDGPALRDRTAQQTLAALAALPSGTLRVVMLGDFCGAQRFLWVQRFLWSRLFCGSNHPATPCEKDSEYSKSQHATDCLVSSIGDIVLPWLSRKCGCLTSYIFAPILLRPL